MPPREETLFQKRKMVQISLFQKCFVYLQQKSKQTMDNTDIQPLLTTYRRMLDATSLTFKRYLYDRINWKVRLIGIKGARGVGKTTLLLQHIKETFPNPESALYVSLDNLWFESHDIEELVEFLYTHGVTHLYFDEVHRFKGWAALLKHLYDSYPELNIVYTGSAVLAIENSATDLSRRQTMYSLGGLSFREYLEYEGIAKVRPLSLAEMLSSHIRYAASLASRIKVLQHFDKYLQTGYYPYYKDAGADYPMRIGEVVRLVIESDIPSVEDITYTTVQKIRKLLMVIAENVPLTPNINKLSSQLESTRDQTLKMLYLLDRAGLLWMLTTEAKDYKHLSGPKKVYLNNPNLMYALTERVSEGTLRETFFANQVGTVASLTMPAQGDFEVNGKYLFEVGGSHKTFDQIADIPDSYLAIDDIETGIGNRIPLWLFGCLY